jgi:Protein of Unknown function (DUF2784)
MLYGILANIIVLVHLGWILFLITGACWGRKQIAVMIVHVAGLLFAVVMQIFGWLCPLTHLEVWLRGKQGGIASYPGSFIAHYAEKFVYMEVTPVIIFILTLALVITNAWIYGRAFRKSGHWTSDGRHG